MIARPNCTMCVDESELSESRVWWKRMVAVVYVVAVVAVVAAAAAAAVVVDVAEVAIAAVEALQWWQWLGATKNSGSGGQAFGWCRRFVF